MLSRQWIGWTTALVCALLFATAKGHAQQGAAAPAILLNGNPLIVSRPPAYRDGEWLVPLLPIVHGVGADIDWVSPNVLRVTRLGGTAYTLSLQTGEIRARLVLIARVTRPARLQFSALTDDVLFPLDAMAPLLGLSVSEDLDKNLIRIDSDEIAESIQHKGPLGFVNVLGLDYTYGFATTGNQSGQLGALRGQTLLGSRKVSGDLEWSSLVGRSPFSLTRAAARVEWDNRRNLSLGDQSTYTGIDAMTGSIRGASYERAVPAGTLYFFAGKEFDGTVSSQESSPKTRFSTGIAGGGIHTRINQEHVSVFGNYFDGPARHGITAGTAISSQHRQNTLRIQLLAGRFDGQSSLRSGLSKAPLQSSGLAGLSDDDPDTSSDISSFVENGRPYAVREQRSLQQVRGYSAGLSVEDTFTPFSIFSITLRTGRYGRNFLTPRDETRFNGRINRSLSFSLQPTRFWSLNGGINGQRVSGIRGAARGYSFGTQLSTGTRHTMLFSYLRSTIADENSGVGRLRIDQVSWILPHYSGRISGAVYGTVVQLDKKPLRTVNTSLNVSSGYGDFEAHNLIQLGSFNRYGAQWSWTAPRLDSFIRFGVDSAKSVTGVRKAVPRVTLRLPFLKSHTLDLGYSRDFGNQLLQVAIRGPLVPRKSVERNEGGEPTLLMTSTLKGQVYFDSNNDGSFNGNDRPIQDVELWLDNALKTVTDSNGTFTFREVAPGAHRLRTDLGAVPAEFALADGSELTIAVVPYAPNIQNIRVLQMGRITGSVSYMDYSEDPDHPVERSLPDARIILGPYLDAYSATDGHFVAGDLPAGEYNLRLDPGIVPEGYSVEPTSTVVRVLPGETTGPVNFRLAIHRTYIEKATPNPD